MGAQGDGDPVIPGAWQTELGLKPDLSAVGSMTSGEALLPLGPGKQDWVLLSPLPYRRFG